MKHSWRMVHRLSAALRTKGIDAENMSWSSLHRFLLERGMSDSELAAITLRMIETLEPPSCPMTHCQHYGGVTAPMMCAAGVIPGRCKILRAFRQRQKARLERKTGEGQ